MRKREQCSNSHSSIHTATRNINKICLLRWLHLLCVLRLIIIIFARIFVLVFRVCRYKMKINFVLFILSLTEKKWSILNGISSLSFSHYVFFFRSILIGKSIGKPYLILKFYVTLSYSLFIYSSVNGQENGHLLLACMHVFAHSFGNGISQNLKIPLTFGFFTIHCKYWNWKRNIYFVLLSLSDDRIINI